MCDTLEADGAVFTEAISPDVMYIDNCESRIRRSNKA